MIVSALMLFSWIAGVFPNKKIDEESSEDISSNNAPEIGEMNNKENQTPEVLMPEPLSHPQQDAPEEIISSDNIPTIVQMDKDLDNVTPEVPKPEPLSHPQQDAPEVEIENLIKILDAANYQLSRVAHLLAEADKPDESYEDSDDDEIITPHFFSDAEILNQTDAETPEVQTPGPLSHPRTDTEVELGNQKIIDDIYQSWRAALLLAEADKPDETDEDSDDEEIPLPSSKRFTFKVTEFPSLPEDSYITLRLNERYNGKIIKRKIISTRDPHWNQKSFSFDVRNAGAATITCKMKRKARLLGVMMMKSTERRRETKLVNNGNRIEQLLANFKVAVVRIKEIEPFDMKEKKSDFAKKKRAQIEGHTRLLRTKRD